jgi:hypothetical protein
MRRRVVRMKKVLSVIGGLFLVARVLESQLFF